MFPDESTSARSNPARRSWRSSEPAAEALDPLAGLPDRPDFVSFFQQAVVVYQLSRGRRNSPQFYGVPVASLRALRDMLGRPEWQADRQRLVEGLSRLKPHSLPPATAVLFGKLIWEVALRHYGIDRGHLGTDDFQVTVVQPQTHDAAAGYGDFAVKVRLSDELYLAHVRPLPDSLDKVMLQAVLEWFLGAFYTYAYELGLRPAPWWQRSATRRWRER